MDLIDFSGVDDLKWIRELGQSALDDLNKRADQVMDKINAEHMCNMHELVHIHQCRLAFINGWTDASVVYDAISPFKTVRLWFNSLSNIQQKEWRDLYWAIKEQKANFVYNDSSFKLTLQVMDCLIGDDIEGFFEKNVMDHVRAFCWSGGAYYRHRLPRQF